MRTKHVIVLPYDSNWKNEFEKIKSELLQVLGNTAISVEHVGSTSVQVTCHRKDIQRNLNKKK
ncbi:MAG: GrpB family protein [Butyrivibrio sp.]|nr:GrpB family protein [Butyrivibrio sp.]